MGRCRSPYIYRHFDLLCNFIIVLFIPYTIQAAQCDKQDGLLLLRQTEAVVLVNCVFVI